MDISSILVELIKTQNIKSIFEFIDKCIIEQINGVGCSIFLVDPTEDKLRVEYSSEIKKEDWDRAVYKRGEGFTGWVFKYRKLLYVPDIEDTVYINNIKPKPPVHAGPPLGKPSGRVGPFMAAPIINRGSLLLCEDDILDLGEFINDLRANNPANHLKSRLSIECSELVGKFPNCSNLEIETLKKSLIKELNELIQGNLFENDILHGLIEDELNNYSPDAEDILNLNRHILEKIFQNSLRKSYIIGVIRMPAIRDDKKKFTNEEISLFRIMASRISGIIENASMIKRVNNLISTYESIGNMVRTGNLDTNDMGNNVKRLESFLNKIVKEIPDIIGGCHCSIFLINDKNLVLKASNSKSTIFQNKIKDNLIISAVGGVGIAPWVAHSGKPIIITNVNNKNELRKIDDNLMPSAEGNEIPTNEIGPLIAAPLITEGKPIGVIRALRHINAYPFEEDDKRFLISLADLLSLVISNSQRRDALDWQYIDRKKRFESIFSEVIIERVKSLSEIDYSPEIQKFFDTGIKREGLSNTILDSLADLWTNKYGQKYNFPLLKEFRNYEIMLLELPRYRDHFIHQYQVFILGSIIIDELYKIKNANSSKKLKSFSDYYNESLNIKEQSPLIADIAWLITSTFHDVAYPIERSPQLFNKFFEKYMGLRLKDLGGKELQPVIDRPRLEKALYDCNYAKLIEELGDLYVWYSRKDGQWKYDPDAQRSVFIDDQFSRGIRYSLIEERDHGVLGSLVLLHQSTAGGEYFSEIIYPSALAIALHNKFFFTLHSDLIFEENPLAFLLRYCDLIQEWGRSSQEDTEKPKLESISIFLNKKNKKIHIRSEIFAGSLKQADEKAIEAQKVFNRLRSKDIIFEFAICENAKEFSSNKLKSR